MASYFCRIFVLFKHFCVVLCIVCFVLFYVLYVCVCVCVCTVLLPPGGYPIAVNKYINIQQAVVVQY